MEDKKVVVPIKVQSIDKFNAYNRINELQLLIKKELNLNEFFKKIF